MLALMHEHNAITLCLAIIILRYLFFLVLLEITLYRAIKKGIKTDGEKGMEKGNRKWWKRKKEFSKEEFSDVTCVLESVFPWYIPLFV